MANLTVQTSQTPRTPVTQGLRLLVVTDDAGHAGQLGQWLGAAGLPASHVTWVRGLGDVGPAVSRGPQDAILLDLGTVHGDALAWMRAHAAGLAAPVIALTAVDSEQAAVEALAAGAQDFLPKGLLGPEVLLRAVRHALERRRSDDSLRQRDEQLRQAQKMEAVGRLAGGIAHDFSNLLMVMIGASENILDRLGAGHPLLGDAETIRTNCERAAGLTRQLLAFSRKQECTPQHIDLRALVQSIGRLLTPLIGEHIFLVTEADQDLWPVLADPLRLEQVVMNLAINARDAMPDGGALTLTLRNVVVGPGLVGHANEPVAPGAYAVLEMCDSGSGMDAETRARAFEPFFTTKPADKGTGLGLSTVCGIVKESGGHLALQTAPGRGTSVRVYLPRAGGPSAGSAMGVTSGVTSGSTSELAAGPAGRPGREPELTGRETVLLTEDEASVRELVQTVLEGSGYTVIAACGLPEALARAEEWPGTIDLLISDIVMPGGTGQELAARLAANRPGLKVLFISGYPEHDAPGLVASDGVAFLSKPFTRKLLLRKLRELLD